MFRSGAFVARHLTPAVSEGTRSGGTDLAHELRDEQVQPNGVDLTLEAVFEQVAPGRIARGGKTVGERRECAFETDGSREHVTLSPGPYVVRYGEVITIPEGHVGFVLPRSSLLRNSCMLDTAVWDAGYEGRGEGLLEVHHEISLERGARIAQLVYARAEHEGTYEGSYQGENVD